ncbi:MAG TPA: biotin--[acetyl-CoA-carboxylase] ligase [Bryobacteraceae bacterium]|jgi:BirA family transcriptional regulator, biotin operon repressor / biotin---[acetyl-CoA-carboxylase] ligase|nr:biotin--[acetyl-CoA-carboxylase] ligase [Bryobacteraceae bacterium]
MAFDLGRRVEWHTTIGSTMTEASRLAAEGAPSGTVVGADEQTAGVGRRGRSWHSEPGTGLYISVILRLALDPAIMPVVTLALGLAVTEAILKATDLSCDLRWPNDVLIQSKKCAGILTQLESSAIIAGIGMNVNHSRFPEELSGIATSLRIASGRTHSRERLLLELLPAIDRYCALLENDGRAPILEMFSRASSYVSGRRVCVDQDGSTLLGTTAGLAESGFLLLRGDDGRDHQIVAGGVRPCS